VALSFSLFTFIDLIAAVLLIVFGLALICVGWVKALQEMQFYEAMSAERYPENPLR
jgi:TRAP-type C4-dicarboxylate transport system permease small subunit